MWISSCDFEGIQTTLLSVQSFVEKQEKVQVN